MQSPEHAQNVGGNRRRQLWGFVSGLLGLSTLASAWTFLWGDSEYKGVAIAGGFAVLVILGALIQRTVRGAGGQEYMISKHAWVNGDASGSDRGVQVFGSILGAGRRVHRALGAWRGFPAERCQWVLTKEQEIGTQTWVEAVKLPSLSPPITFRPIPGVRRQEAMYLTTDRDELKAQVERQWAIVAPAGMKDGLLTFDLARLLLDAASPRIPVHVVGDYLFTARSSWRKLHSGVEERLDFLARIASSLTRGVLKPSQAESVPEFRPEPERVTSAGHNVYAIVSFILSVTIVLSPLGLGLAYLGNQAIQRGRASNRRMVFAALVLGWGALGVLVLITVVGRMYW